MRTNFYIDTTNADKKGLAPIFFYISHRGHRLKFYTGEKINPDDWDETIQRAKPKVKNTELLNDLLDAMEEEPKTIERKARINGEDCTIEHLRKNLTYFQPKSDDFFTIFDEFIKRESKGWAPNSIRRWKHLKDNLEKFDKKYKLEFDSINQEFADKFIDDRIKNGWTNVTIKKAVSMTIQFVRWSFKNRKHKSEDFRDIEVKLKTVQKGVNVVYLTPAELGRIYKLNLKEQDLAEVRDVFVFSCLTGLAYDDLSKLRRSNIRAGKIYKDRGKTGVPLGIPLTLAAQQILDRYKNLPGEKPLPVPHDVIYNEKLKSIAFRAKLLDAVTNVKMQGGNRIETTLPKWEMITSHVGRKTFTTLAIHLGINITVTAKWTGHKTDEIERYYTILDSKQEKEMNKFNTLLKIA